MVSITVPSVQAVTTFHSMLLVLNAVVLFRM